MRLFNFFIILFLILLSTSVKAMPASQPNPVKQIMEKLFNAETDEADKLIEYYLAKNPEHPKYYFIKAHYNFYMRYFSNRPVSRDSIIQIIIDNGEKAVEWGESYKATTDLKFYLGASYGMLSRAYMMRQQTWNSFWAARSCISYLEQVLKEDPQYFDAYLPLAVIKYFPTRLTDYRGTLAAIAGMGGDKELAFKYFKLTHKKGKMLKDEAAFILASLYRAFENDYSTSFEYYEELINKFPDNQLLNNQFSTVKLGALIELNSVEYLQENFTTLRDEYNIINSNVLNNMGYSFLNGQRNDIAEQLFLYNITLFPEEANPYDSLSEFYQTIGNNEQAIKYATIGLTKVEGDQTADAERKELLRGLMEERIKTLSLKPAM